MQTLAENETLSLQAGDEHSIRVTVVIPAYNAAATLEKAVRSVIAQTEKSVEIHIVDDCSTDNTWDVIQSLQREIPNLAATRLAKNGGAPLASNYGIRAARGKWVAILDADDWYEPQRLARIIDAAEAAGAQMGADNQYFVDPITEAVVSTAYPVCGRTYMLDLDSFQANSDATRSFDLGMLKPVYLKEFIFAKGIEYYAPARCGYDYYINFCFFALGGKGIVIDEPLYDYVQPFGQVSRQWSAPSRRRYPFENMKLFNDHFVETFRASLTQKQLRRLELRGRQFHALATIHQTREAFREGRYGDAFRRIIGGFPSVWWTAAKIVGRKYAMLPATSGAPGPQTKMRFKATRCVAGT